MGVLVDADLIDRVRNFVHSALSPNIADQDDIFRSGLVTSLFGIRMIAFIEKEFRVVVGDEDLSLENFSSVMNICKFVEAKSISRGQ